MKAFSADAGYRGTAVEFTSTKLTMTLPFRKKLKGNGLSCPNDGWSSGGFLGHFRRLSKDFEILPATSENMIVIAMLKITLAKLLRLCKTASYTLNNTYSLGLPNFFIKEPRRLSNENINTSPLHTFACAIYNWELWGRQSW
ncbi:hypothetical protein [Candidatus Methylobacter favarea]|uniref:hypothetical protein n=1 Tax=Candidatus Methylobacter favarea TaxID=2707345 RepID=UPI00157BC748|nr:hypothetical protein [Candidatus Methylobacter favarea]